jgi:hypothetical protein
MKELASIHELLDDAELMPCTARQALQREPVDLEVRDGEEVFLSPLRRGHHKYFAKVRVAAFEDLQVLGLVPRRLREQAVRAAIASDDQDALRLAQERVARGTAPAAACSCESGHHHPPSFSRDLKSTYRDIREDYHPALSRILSEHFGTEFAWDSTLAGSVGGWVRRLTARDLIVTTLIAKDITIGRRATLVLHERSTVLLARAVRIHRTGRLVHRGGFLRIWASSIDSFLDFVDVISQNPSVVPWHLDALGGHHA